MDKQKRVMAIHDISCVGRCSLTVALPVLSAAGFDTGVLPTAVLSTHTGGFEGFTFRDLTEDIMPIARHWQSLGLAFDALYTGFLGSYAQIDLIAALFQQFKTPDTLVMVDPVMADNGQLYAVYSNEMVEGMRKLCKDADIIVPNMTEAAFLLDEPYVAEGYDEKYIEQLLRKLSGLGAKQVVLTGVSFQPDKLGAACYDKITGQVEYAFGDKVEGFFHGTGDLFASTLLAGLLNNHSLLDATTLAVNVTYKAIIETMAAGQEKRYGVCFERALPYLMECLGK